MTWKVKRDLCWADPSGESCANGPTNEHVVSAGILKRIGPIRFKVNGEAKAFGRGSYKLSLLCQKHNEMLSNYDNEMIRFIDSLRMITTESHRDTAPGRTEINGHWIELWFAKTLVNSCFFHSIIEPSNQFFFPSGRSIFDQIRKGRSFPEPYGLYFDTVSNISMRERLAAGPNFMCVQEKDAWLTSPSGKTTAYRVPWCYSFSYRGIFLAGYFNPLSIRDSQFQELTAGDLAILQEMQYRKFHIKSGSSSDANAFRELRIAWHY